MTYIIEICDEFVMIFFKSLFCSKKTTWGKFNHNGHPSKHFWENLCLSYIPKLTNHLDQKIFVWKKIIEINWCTFCISIVVEWTCLCSFRVNKKKFFPNHWIYSKYIIFFLGTLFFWTLKLICLDLWTTCAYNWFPIEGKNSEKKYI